MCKLKQILKTMNIKIIIFVFFFFFIISQTQAKSSSPLNKALKTLDYVQKLRAQLQDLFQKFTQNKNNIKNAFIPAVKEDIQWRGVSFGNRWRIAEEGTNSYEALVFRDLTKTTAGKDSRYAMWPNKYINK